MKFKKPLLRTMRGGTVYFYKEFWKMLLRYKPGGLNLYSHTSLISFVLYLWGPIAYPYLPQRRLARIQCPFDWRLVLLANCILLVKHKKWRRFRMERLHTDQFLQMSAELTTGAQRADLHHPGDRRSRACHHRYRYEADRQNRVCHPHPHPRRSADRQSQVFRHHPHH